MSDELCMQSAAELRERIRTREVSPVDVVQSALSRAERLQPTLNCFITLCPERALDEARRAEQAVLRGEAVGSLHGVPFTAKDLVNTAGVRTTYGSLLFENNVPTADAVAVARLRAAGAILIGKTTTPEFGHKGMTDAPLFGRTANPWDVSRTCGGSSGGAAVAVAAGIAPLAVATDGGGSTRIPAACTGTLGLKQTLGTIPHSQTTDVFGNTTFVTPLTRTALDTALMLDVMAGPHASDPWSLGVVPQDYLAAARMEGDLRGKRILFSLTLGNTRVAKDVERAATQAARVLERLGAKVDALDRPVPESESVWRTVNHARWRANYGKMVAEHRARMSPSLVRQVEEAEAWSATDYQQAMFDRTAIFRTVQGWLADADYLVTPTLSRTAVPITQDLFDPVEIDGEIAGELRRNWYPYTMPFNTTGHPAISFNCGFGADGLPIALQAVGRYRDEASLLRLAALFEHASPELDRRPRV
jgi:aspartyl-tRNA(Asn)/glutamyl-tRNA(Gln) amidotransferase subunit A